MNFGEYLALVRGIHFRLEAHLGLFPTVECAICEAYGITLCDRINDCVDYPKE